MTSLPSPRDRRVLGRWFVLWAALVLITVVIGGVTRLTESGLSITEWQPVSGVLPPLSEAAWEDAFARYRETREYRELNSSLDLAGFRRIYWIEWIHRFWARLVGLAIALPALVFLLRGRLDRMLRSRLLLVLVLMAAQGALGWYMVRSGLSDRTEVSPYRLAAHLGLALLIFGIMVATASELASRPQTGNRSARLRRAAGTFVVLVVVTAIAGAFVAGLDAGRSYNTFPLMGGRIFPLGYFHLEPWWRNLFEHVTAVQFNHRVLGVATALGALGLGWMTRKAERPVRLWGRAVALTGLLQMGLGIATLLLFVPIPVAALHQAGAVVLLGLALLLFRAVSPRAAETPEQAAVPRHRRAVLDGDPDQALSP